MNEQKTTAISMMTSLEAPSGQPGKFKIWVRGPNYYAVRPLSRDLTLYEVNAAYLLQHPYFEGRIKWIQDLHLQDEKCIVGDTEIEDYELWHVILYTLTHSLERFYIPAPYLEKAYTLYQLWDMVFGSWTLPESLAFIYVIGQYLNNLSLLPTNKRALVEKIQAYTFLKKQCNEEKKNSKEQEVFFYEAVTVTMVKEILSKVWYNEDLQMQFCRLTLETLSSFENLTVLERYVQHIFSVPFLTCDCPHWAWLVLQPNPCPKNEFFEKLRDISCGILPEAFDVKQTKKRKATSKNCQCSLSSSQQFEYRWFPGVILAGSAFVYCSGQGLKRPTDIDLWVLDGNKTVLMEVITKIWNQMKLLEGQTFLIIQTSILTFLGPRNLRIQIIFTQNRTPWNIIRKFDFDFLRGYYDGQSATSGWLLPECLTAWQSKVIQNGNRQVDSFRVKKAEEQGYLIHDVFWQAQHLESEEKLHELKMAEEKGLRSQYKFFYPPPEMTFEHFEYLIQKSVDHCNIYNDLSKFLEHSNQIQASARFLECLTRSVNFPLDFGERGDYGDPNDNIIDIQELPNDWKFRPSYQVSFMPRLAGQYVFPVCFTLCGIAQLYGPVFFCNQIARINLEVDQKTHAFLCKFSQTMLTETKKRYPRELDTLDVLLLKEEKKHTQANRWFFPGLRISPQANLVSWLQYVPQKVSVYPDNPFKLKVLSEKDLIGKFVRVTGEWKLQNRDIKEPPSQRLGFMIQKMEIFRNQKHCEVQGKKKLESQPFQSK